MTSSNEIDFGLKLIAPDAATALIHDQTIRAAFAWAYPQHTRDPQGNADPTHAFDRQVVQHVLDVVEHYTFAQAQQQALTAAQAQLAHTLSTLQLASGVTAGPTGS